MLKKLALLSIVILSFISCQQSSIYENTFDNDMDGLPDELESERGMNTDSIDTDGDGLSDYEEYCKYMTDPTKPDTDEDGLPDGDWEERKEYTYSITAKVYLRKPFNINHMNDLWQDARLLEEASDRSLFEVVLYPDVNEIFISNTYEPVNDELTQPTFEKNYSDAMKSSVRNHIKNLKNEYDASSSLLKLVYESEYEGVGESMGCSTDLPIQFSFRFLEDGSIDYDSVPDSTQYSKDEILDKVFFADAMYSNKTRGACSSSATLRGGIFRAAGIKEKSIFTVPLIFSGFDDEVTFDVKDKYMHGYIDVYSVADHVYNEIFIGNRWVRVDGDVIGAGMGIGDKLYLKILEFDDSTEQGFYHYWNYDTYGELRPYQYVSVIEKRTQT